MSKALSSTTKVVSLRLSNDVVDTLSRRAKKQGKLVSEYLRERVNYDTTRKHRRRPPLSYQEKDIIHIPSPRSISLESAEPFDENDTYGTFVKRNGK